LPCFVIACQIALQLVRQGAIIESAVPVAELNEAKVECVETSTESVDVSSNKQNNETPEEAEIVHTGQTLEEAEIVQMNPQPDDLQSSTDQPTDSKVS
jgi:Lon-like ATP-dependent protease